MVSKYRTEIAFLKITRGFRLVYGLQSMRLLCQCLCPMLCQCLCPYSFSICISPPLSVFMVINVNFCSNNSLTLVWHFLLTHSVSLYLSSLFINSISFLISNILSTFPTIISQYLCLSLSNAFLHIQLLFILIFSQISYPYSVTIYVYIQSILYSHSVSIYAYIQSMFCPIFNWSSFLY